MLPKERVLVDGLEAVVADGVDVGVVPVSAPEAAGVVAGAGALVVVGAGVGAGAEVDAWVVVPEKGSVY